MNNELVTKKDNVIFPQLSIFPSPFFVLKESILSFFIALNLFPSSRCTAAWNYIPWSSRSIQLIFFCSYLIWVWWCILWNFPLILYHPVNHDLPGPSLISSQETSQETPLLVCFLHLHGPHPLTLFSHFVPSSWGTAPWIHTPLLQNDSSIYTSPVQTTQLNTRLIH